VRRPAAACARPEHRVVEGHPQRIAILGLAVLDRDNPADEIDLVSGQTLAIA